MNNFRQRYARRLVFVGLYHLVLIFGAGWAVYDANRAELGSLSVPTQALWTNVALFGFIGSLLYFSRKIYVYLITDKVGRILATFGSTDDDDRVKAALIGYFWYLVWRPYVGLAVGPLVTFIVLGGLNTVAKSQTEGVLALSQAGICIIYVLCFVGGYTSSDLLDYLSKTGGKLLISSKSE